MAYQFSAVSIRVVITDRRERDKPAADRTEGGQ